MTNSGLRSKLNEFIEAEENTKAAIFQKNADDLMSDAADLEMKAWILEEQDNQETVTKLKADYKMLRMLQAFKRLDEDKEEGQRLTDLLIAWIQTEDWKTSEAYLQQHQEDLLSELAEVVLIILQHNDPNNPLIEQHLTLLRACRELSIKEVYETFQSNDEDSDLGKLMDDLITTYDDEEKITILLDHFPSEMLDPLEKSIETEISEAKDPARAEALKNRLGLIRKVRAKLISDELLTGEEYILFHLFFDIQNRQEMDELIEEQPDEVLDKIERIAEQQLSVTKRENKVEMIRDRLKAFKLRRYEKRNPLIKLVKQFLITQSDNEAKDLLLKNASLLLTLDARNVLEDFSGSLLILDARHKLEDFSSSDSEIQQHIDARRSLWNALYRERYEKTKISLSVNDVLADRSPQNPTQAIADLSRQFGTQESKFLVVRAENCAIGDGAITINNIGRIPLEWKRPQEFQRNFTEKAVGREKELEELHKSLQAETSAAVVGKGTSSAVQGLPGVGKSTLAALYAERYADQYPGGIIWVKLGPDYATAESVGPKISQIAAYAYSGDAQTYQMFGTVETFNLAEQVISSLKNTQFTPEVVRMLISGHGSVLVIVDDAWDKAVINPIRDMLPVDGYLLVTTRELRVAVDVGKKLELDVLSEADALKMIGRTLANMTEEQAKQLARTVGYHPLALDVALGDLAVRSREEWQENIDEIARLITEGESLDALPLPDNTNREHRVEVVLRYSYDAMGKLPNGFEYQRRFRALGCFAPEADFDIEMVAAIWGDKIPQAKEYMNVFAARALVRRQESGRWSQHTILRAYALLLQSVDERIRLPELHAESYLKRVQYLDKIRKYPDIITEISNLKYAFEWAIKESFTIALNLMINSAEALGELNLGELYLNWSERVLQRAQVRGEKATHDALMEKVAALSTSTSQTRMNPEEQIQRLKEALEIGTSLLPQLDAEAKFILQDNLVGILKQLAFLPGEDKQERLLQALTLYEDVLPSRADDTRLLSNYAALLYMLSALPTEDQKVRLQEALVIYEKILPLRQNIPLAYASSLNGYINVLWKLSALPDENGKQRLMLALKLAKQAIDLWQSIPYRYVGALLLISQILRDVAKLEPENSEKFLKEELAFIYKVLKFDESDQIRVAVMLAKELLIDLILDMGVSPFRAAWNDISGNQPLPTLAAAQLVQAFMKHENIQPEELETTVNEDVELQQKFIDLMKLAQDGHLVFMHKADVQRLVVAWLRTKDWESSKTYLLQNQDGLLMDPAIEVLKEFVQQNTGKPILEQHVAILKACQQLGIEAAYQNLRNPKQVFKMWNKQLLALLNDWLNKPNWLNSEAYLHENQADLLTEEAEETLQMLQEDSPDDFAILLHLEILSKCRKQGIQTGYTNLPAKPLTTQQIAELLIEWIKLAPDWQASQTYLSQRGEQLLTQEAEKILEEILQQNQQHPSIKQHVELLKACLEQGIEKAYEKHQNTLAKQVKELVEKVSNLLIEWISTPNWQASQEYLIEHKVELLTDSAESTLLLLFEHNPDNGTIKQHIELLKACREKGIEASYIKFHSSSQQQNQIADLLVEWMKTADWQASEVYLNEHSDKLLTDLAETVLQLLLQSNPGNRTIEDHIVLLHIIREKTIKDVYTLAVLETMVEDMAQVRSGDHPDLVTEIQNLILPLLGIYNQKSAENIDRDTHERCIRIYNRLISLLRTIGQLELQEALCSSVSQTLNVLGNYYAEKPGQEERAIEAYTQSLQYDPRTALVYRNRAGTYIAEKKYEQAKADLEKAQSFDPEAQRLPLLWRDLYLAQADGEAMLPYALALRDRNVEEATGHYYVAIAHALINKMEEAATSIRIASQLVADSQRGLNLKRLRRLEADHPQHAEKLEQLYAILEEKPVD